MTPWGNAILLAEEPGLGRVWDCGECGNIHVSIGPVTVCLDPAAYVNLVAMLNASAANFEEWIQYKQNGALSSGEEPHSPGGCFPKRASPGAKHSPGDEQQA